MSDRNTIPISKERGDAPRQAPATVTLPQGATALIELRADAIAHALGYFRGERFVVFGYCPGGGEVIWKDGHSSGFGTGGWRMFLDEIAPLAAAYEVNIGGIDRAGTHVLLIDRIEGSVYAAPRASAEDFLARVNGVALSDRRCLCAPLDCESCPVRSCPYAGLSRRLDPGSDGLRCGDPTSSGPPP